jgi:large subunit ribosomal protein L31
MKSGIHPKWNHQAKVVCACGNTFETGSAQDEIHVDICYACHPFYTGSMKFLDTQGRVDRFMKMRAAAASAGKKKKTDKKDAPKQESLSLKDMLAQEKSKIIAAEKSEKTA